MISSWQVHFSRASGPAVWYIPSSRVRSTSGNSVLPRTVIDRPNLAETMHRIKTRLKRRLRTARDFFLIRSRSMLVVLPALLPIVASLSAPAFAQAPGPELFAKEPRTQLELWEAIDYLLRTGQAKKALPYIDKFVKTNPDAATWIAIRNRFGPGSILRLSDDPLTQQFAKPFSEAMLAASRSEAQRPERIARYVAALSGTRPEQQFAVRRLREAGPFAVPVLVQALKQPGLAPEARQRIVDNMGELDRSAVPPLVATLDSPDPTLAADAAAVLGMIGDKRAIPPLTEKAASPKLPEAVRKTAERAIARLTGRPFDSQERTPTQVLADAAWRLHRHQVDLGGEPVLLWAWDKAAKCSHASRGHLDGGRGHPRPSFRQRCLAAFA